MKAAINAFCDRIGHDRLLVQGAGGNVSWKEDSILWIKASGTWLRDALHKDIFVPVDLTSLQRALTASQFDVNPQPIGSGSSTLRPSIETVLHGLMPQKVVVHVHAIEALARLVSSDASEQLNEALANVPWKFVIVPYRKPGAELAAAVSHALAIRPDASVVFLMNHGVVVADDTLEGVEHLLKQLTAHLQQPSSDHSKDALPLDLQLQDGTTLQPIPDPELQSLATNPRYLQHVKRHWALYPDHVVFLGAQASVFDTTDCLNEACLESRVNTDQPQFVEGVGVFSFKQMSEARIAQLRCYFDVITRQNKDSNIAALSLDEIGELLGWEAEKYRQTLNK